LFVLLREFGSLRPELDSSLFNLVRRSLARLLFKNVCLQTHRERLPYCWCVEPPVLLSKQVRP
jgi:hypothetical protein